MQSIVSSVENNTHVYCSDSQSTSYTTKSTVMTVPMTDSRDIAKTLKTESEQQSKEGDHSRLDIFKNIS